MLYLEAERANMGLDAAARSSAVVNEDTYLLLLTASTRLKIQCSVVCEWLASRAANNYSG